MKRQPSKSLLLFVVMLVLQLLVMGYWGGQKEGYFCDEMFSYGLANSYDEWHLYERDDYMNVWHDSSYWDEYLTVQNGERLEYGMVVRNQIEDRTHPPLYYFVLHTICSFFPGTFSKWFGILPNIAFFVLLQSLLYLVGRELFRDDFSALTVCALYGFSVGAINAVILIRMYTMLSALCMLQYYLHIRLWRAVEAGRVKSRNLMLMAIFMSTLAGFMTQYYFLIFAFFVSALFCLYQMLRGRWKLFAQYAATMAAALGCGYLLYPSSLGQIIGEGDRGREAFANLQSTDLMERMGVFWKILSDELFLGGLTLIALALTAILAVWLIRRFLRLSVRKEGEVFHLNVGVQRTADGLSLSVSENHLIFLMAAAALAGYFVIVSKVASFEADRYIFAIFPFAVLAVYAAVRKLAALFTRRCAAINICLLLVALSGNVVQYVNEDVSYIYRDQGALRRQIAAEHPEISALYVTFGDWSYVFNTTLLAQYEGVYCMAAEDIDRSLDVIHEYAQDHDELMVHISYTYRDQWEQIIKHLVSRTAFNTYEKIFDNSDGIYLLTKEKSPAAAIDNGLYIIRTQDGSQALTVKGGDLSNGANVVVAGWDPANDSIPVYARYENDQCVFYFEHSGKALDVWQGLDEPGVNVQQYQRNEWDAQYWTVVPAGDGGFFIRFRENTALTCDPLSSNVYIDRFDGRPEQKWLIEPAA